MQSNFFRQEAFQHYMQRGEEIVMPRLIRPAVFQRMWLLIVVLLLLIGIFVLHGFSVQTAGHLTATTTGQKELQLPSIYANVLEQGDVLTLVDPDGTVHSAEIISIGSTLELPNTQQQLAGNTTSYMRIYVDSDLAIDASEATDVQIQLNGRSLLFGIAIQE